VIVAVAVAALLAVVAFLVFADRSAPLDSFTTARGALETIEGVTYPDELFRPEGPLMGCNFDPPTGSGSVILLHRFASDLEHSGSGSTRRARRVLR
jgi:hypothetical protein